MPEIVVKGMDSAEAMEQVTKLLVDHGVIPQQMTQMPKPAASSALETPSGFAQVLAKTLKNRALPDYDGADSGPAAHNVTKGRYDWPLETTALVGPLGAGKSQLALQIATQWMQHDQRKPRIIYCGNGSVSDAGRQSKLSRIFVPASAVDADVPESIDLGIAQMVVPAGLRMDGWQEHLHVLL